MEANHQISFIWDQVEDRNVKDAYLIDIRKVVGVTLEKII